MGTCASGLGRVVVGRDAEPAGFAEEDPRNPPARSSGSRRKSPTPRKSTQGEQIVVIKIPKADLTRNFETFGRMDPFVAVSWRTGDGESLELSRTRTDWNGHLEPRWEHTCRGHGYAGLGSGDRAEFRVFDRNVGLRPTFMGAAFALIDDLVADCLPLEGEVPAEGDPAAVWPPPRSQTVAEGPARELELWLGGKPTGTLTVETLLVSGDHDSCSALKSKVLSYVDADLFEAEAPRLGVSGGTAPFFRLRLRDPEPWQSPEFYVGKDLSRASDEVQFYEQMRALAEVPGQGGLQELLAFALPYAGVYACQAAGSDDDRRPRDLLVMRNLCDGYGSLRLMDVKIGQRTAQAGWQGKSRVAAVRQSVVDGITNSSCEGFRLEGFDGRPPALASMDPLLDLGVTSRSSTVVKKALRVMLQRMNAAEMLMHFVDVHQSPADPGAKALANVRSPYEVSELALHESAVRLAELALACHRAPVPQKWVGSSVALGFECGRLPPRAEADEAVRRAVQVHIFDWGRSELNTLERHMGLSDKEQRDRALFWSYYVGGVTRLSWEVARCYHHRFGNADQWHKVSFTVFDFDSMSADDFLGHITVPVEETAEKTVVLMESAGARLQNVVKHRGAATLTYSMEWRDYPAGSRLRGAWRLTVLRARNLPAMDKTQFRATSDPRCEVVAHSDEDSGFCFRQLTSVRPRTLDPVWDECFELPLIRETGALEAALELAVPGLGGDTLDPLLPPEAMMEWSISSCASCSGRRPCVSEDTNCTDWALRTWESRIRGASEVRRASTRASTRASRTSVCEAEAAGRANDASREGATDAPRLLAELARTGSMGSSAPGDVRNLDETKLLDDAISDYMEKSMEKKLSNRSSVIIEGPPERPLSDLRCSLGMCATSCRS